jgi:hypothetical protein
MSDTKHTKLPWTVEEGTTAMITSTQLDNWRDRCEQAEAEVDRLMGVVEPRIKLIAGMEPNRDGEWPTTFAIGNGFPGPVKHTITRIDRREQNMGTYGILWFDVFDGDALLASMNAMAVSEVQYDDL